jgi:hypothetical protein
MKPIALKVHPKPIDGSKVLAILGYIKPPVTLPHETTPITMGSLLLKYMVISVIIGVRRSPLPRPVHSPCERTTCQYSSVKDVMNVPSVTSIAPDIVVMRRYPASVRRPLMIPMKKRRKTAMEPTHAISERAWFRVET